MEYYKNVRTSSLSSPYKKRYFRSAKLIRDKGYFEQQRSDQNLNSDIINHNNNNFNNIHMNNDNANNLISYEHLSESWIELVLPFTILAITIFAVIFIAIVIFIWIQKYFREKSEQTLIDNKIQQSKVFCAKEKKIEKVKRKMNNRKWLRDKSKQIDSQVVSNLEQKLETVEFKSTPPTSPNSQKFSEEEQQSEESDGEYIEEMSEVTSEKESEISSAILPCPLAISVANSIIQPQNLSEPQIQQVNSSSSLAFLQEEVHSIQPKDGQISKIFKSTATSPPPFSPIATSQHKYATTGTQTYFTKAPNSPNNMLSSAFAVLQTPTSSTSNSNPFIITPSSDNKENKEPKHLRNVCLNKTISSFKHDNGGGTSSSASSPSSVISTSPKVNTNVLQQQNSPIICSESPSNRFNFSPRVHVNSNSPPISATTQKVGNYFRFPEIETPPATVSLIEDNSKSINLDEPNIVPIVKSFENLSIESDKEGIILKIDEVESPVKEERRTFNNNNNNNNYDTSNTENTLTIRRARLKSISLDSDGARLVEENLTMPVEELVEIASYNNKQIMDSESERDLTATASCANNNENINNRNNNNNNRFNPKNIYNLTINLDFRDSSLDITENSDINMNQDQEYDETDDGISRTPTMKYFQKKAVSLDSDQDGNKMVIHQQFAGKTASSETFNYYFGQNSKMNSSISVPSTPKHLTSTKLKISSTEDRGGNHNVCGGRYSRKLRSFEENVDDSAKAHASLHQQPYKTNLTASIQTLNLSSSNLKTLPEIASINDFDGNQSLKPASRIPSSIPPRSIPPSKSGILQRRGSNHSLTLNLDGSCGNLTRGLSCSNYSLGNLHGSHLNIAGSNYNLQNQANSRLVTVKKNLLQRRGSNTSLTLNIQGSNNNLNRFNSHSSLNILGSSQKKGGLLERRNSNASLTLNIQNRGLSISNCNLRGSECSLSSVNTNQMGELIMTEQEADHDTETHAKATTEKYSRHQRKFLSSENLNNIRSTSIGSHHRQQSQHPTPYGSIDNLKQSRPYQVPVISTKPLSPQSTSEDFKIYLANIQFLQSASNILDEEHLKLLHALFQKSYNSKPKESESGANQRQFNNDDILNSKIGTDGALISFGTSSPVEDQKQLLIKLHQEFWNLPTNYQEKPMVFGSQSKNRYKTILPNEHSRVMLQKEDGVQQEPYINANFIKGPDYASDCYIATQGPMQNTVYEFWLMVLQNIQKCNGQGIQKIAMLTDFIESQRQKCAIYFPVESGNYEIFANTGSAQDENLVRDYLEKMFNNVEDAALILLPKISFNFFIIKNVGIKQKNGYSIRKIFLYYGNFHTRKLQQYTVYHYWFPDWPDHRSPSDIDVLLDMSLDLLDGKCTKDFEQDGESDARTDKNPLPIIHCSAGIGRTGCLAAILNGLGQMRSNNNCSSGISVDILGIVCNLRLQRGGMVQNSEQYELIHRSLCLYQQKLYQKN